MRNLRRAPTPWRVNEHSRAVALDARTPYLGIGICVPQLKIFLAEPDLLRENEIKSHYGTRSNVHAGHH